MMIACILLSAALAATLFWAFSLKQDIKQISRKLDMINKTETNAQLNTQTTDKDIATLAKNINVMLEQGHRDLMDKVRAENELKRALTNISHDLRTPLTSARGYLQMLQSGDLDAETQLRYLETVMERLDALGTLINSLFEFTRVVEGRTELVLKRLNIAGALRESIAAFYSEFCEKGFTVEADIPETPVYALADKDALARILQNVIRNVVVHGTELMTARLMHDGEIIISNRARDIQVVDAERLFERFYTADASRTTQSTGLGLAIAKELASQMNGNISATIENDLLLIRIRLQIYR